jgi:threonine dehydratase
MPEKPLRMGSISAALIDLQDSDSLSLVWPSPIIPPRSEPDRKTDYLPLILNARVYDVAIESPLQYARKLSSKLQATIYLKREDLQPIYSFKCRGAFNKMYHLTKDQKRRGVCCVSAGNHAQGVALAAQKMGIKATIVMPSFAPEIKVENVRRLGANVILFGNDFDEAKKECMRIIAEQNLTFVPPFDDPLVIAGQGTVGMEILNQMKHTRLDAIFVCCGGGGLLAGIAAFVKRVRPEVRIIGVNTVDSDSMFQSLLVRKPVQLEKAGFFSDGTSVKLVGAECVNICQQYVDDMVKVNNDEICAAIKDCYEESRSILEPAGALGLAGMKKYLMSNPGLKNGVYIGICSGANMNFDRLRFVAERAAVGDGREALLSVMIAEKPGTLKLLHDLVFPRNISELSYRYSDSKEAHIFLGFQITDPKEVESVVEDISSAGLEALDISNNHMASQHVRYMAGGRSLNVKDEWFALYFNYRLFRLRLPEKPGSLKEFFSLLDPNWNISLFHYRNHGSDYGRVLVGVQIPNRTPEIISAFIERMQSTGIKDIVDECNNPAYVHFKRG